MKKNKIDVDYVIYKLKEYPWTWCIFNVKDNACAYISNLRKYPGKYTINKLYKMYVDADLVLFNKKKGKDLEDTIRLFEDLDQKTKIKILKVYV